MRNKYAAELQAIFVVQRQIQDLHPFLTMCFPVAIVEDQQFFIFEVDITGASYRLVKTATVDMPLPERVRAAFPLTCHADQICCVVTPDVFDDEAGYITIFHEFIHCYQFTSGEQQLKQTLQVAQAAMAKQDYLWELNHPFPYADEHVEETYRTFLAAAAQHDSDAVLHQRRCLQRRLAHYDYEYMVWQEWKEGFARFIENKIRVRLGFVENYGGAQPPFSRVTFYAGGARYIEMIENAHPPLLEKIDLLFHYIKDVA